MSQPDTPIIRCPNCDKAYRWTIELGGKKVRCKCSQQFRIPALASGKVEAIGPPVVADSPKPAAKPVVEGYEIDLDEPTAKPSTPASDTAPALSRTDPTKCPGCGSRIKPEAIICINCGLNLREGRKVQTKVITDPAADTMTTAAKVIAQSEVNKTLAADIDARANRDEEMAAEAERQHRFDNVQLPLILSGVSAVVLVISNMGHSVFDYSASGSLSGLALGASRVALAAVRFLIQVPLLFVGIFVVARLFGTSYGGVGTALLKLMAVALCSAAASDTMLILIYLMTGGVSVMGVETMMAFGASLIVFMGACMKLLDMDSLEALVLYMLLIIGPFVVLLFLGAAVSGFFG